VNIFVTSFSVVSPAGEPPLSRCRFYYDTCHSKFQPCWVKNRETGVKQAETGGVFSIDTQRSMAKISAVTKMLKIANRTLLSLREAAKLYNVSVNTLSRHAKIGTLPTQRVTGFRVVFVDTEDLERWMQEHYQQKRAQRARQWWAKRKRKRQS